MSHDGMDYFSFGEPSAISSRQFLTQQYTVHPSDGHDYFYTPGTSARIEISGASQNSFILPRTMRLVYHAVSQVQTLADGSPATPPTANDADTFEGVGDLRIHPGLPFYGAPHLGSVQTEIPGLSSNMSSLVADGQSQRWYAQRLLCSGDEGDCVVPGLKSTFRQKGKAWEAGGRDVIARANGITGSFWRQIPGEANAQRDHAMGGFQKYDVPAAAWFDLADGASSVLPLPYLTSSSSNLLVRVNWAPVSSALVGNNRARSSDLISYVVGGVSLEWTAVNVIDAQILASIEQLFRGQVSVPIMEGVAVPMPMVLSHRAYRFASTTLAAPSGSVSLRVPAGKAACNAVLLKIDPSSGTDGSRYVAGARPVIRNAVLRVGSARFPAREVSDIDTGSSVPRGLASAKWGLITTTAGDAANDGIGGATVVPTSAARAAEMYKECRQFFSLFDNDSYDCVPAAELFDSTHGPSSAASKLAGTSILSPSSVTQVAKYTPATGISAISKGVEESTYGPNMFIFPLQAFLPEDSMRSRGYAVTGVDLRNQCDVVVEFEILGAQMSGVNLIPSTGGAPAAPSVPQWEISAAIEYTEMATLLPSRVDLEASSSLLPSAAGSVASGGGAAGI